MTREDKSVCPVCGKKKQRMYSHFSISHPDLNPDDYGVLGPNPKAEAVPAPAADLGFAVPPPSAEPEPQPDPAPADPGLAQAINSLLGHIEQQAATIQAQQERIEVMGKEMQSFQASVLQNFNEVPKLVKGAVTAQFDQILAEAQARAGGNGQPDAGMVPPDPPQPSGNSRADMMMQLFPLVMQAISGGNKPAGGDLMGQIAMLKQIAEAFNPLPNILAGMNMATTMFTAAARAGINPADAAKGNEHLITSMTQIGQPPPAGTGQTH